VPLLPGYSAWKSSGFPEIKVRAYDLEGRKVKQTVLDFAARVVQHEIDHLEGKLIVGLRRIGRHPEKTAGFLREILFRTINHLSPYPDRRASD